MPAGIKLVVGTVEGVKETPVSYYYPICYAIQDNEENSAYNALFPDIQAVFS